MTAHCHTYPTDHVAAAIDLEPYKEFTTQTTSKLIAAVEALREVLEKVRQCCLFDDDAGEIGVTNDPHIPPELFNEICAALQPPHKPAG